MNVDLPVIHRGTDLRVSAPVLPRPGTVSITSPPYLSQANYGLGEGEWGSEGLDRYLEDSVAAARNLFSVMDLSGVVFWVIGDSASGSGGAGGDYTRDDGHRSGKLLYRGAKSDLADGQWIDVPGRTLHALQDSGIRCRAQIVWDKGVGRPGDPNHYKRPFYGHEMIYMLTRATKNTYPWSTPGFRGLPEQHSVWKVPISSGRDTRLAALFWKERGRKQLCPFPVELAERCLRLTHAQGDPDALVVDLMAGRGTVGWAAETLGLDYYLADLVTGWADLKEQGEAA